MADDVKFNVQVDLKGREAFATASNEIKALSQQAQQAGASIGTTAPGGLGAGMVAANLATVALGAALAVTSAALVGLASAAGAAVVAAAQYETTLAKIQALTPTTAAEIDKIRVSLLGMAGEVGKAPNELAEGMYFLASSGVTGARGLEALTLAAKGSAAGMGETKAVAQTLVSIMNSYESTGMTAARAMDILTATIIQGGAEANTLATSLGRVVGIAATAGVSFEEVGAYIATFTRTIPSAAEAVTSLRQLIMNLRNPSEQTKTALASLRISVESLTGSIRERGLMVTLQELFERTKGNVAILGDLIPNVRALAGAMATMGTQAGSYKTALDAMYNSTGALNTAFKIVQATLAWQWSSVTASWQAMKIAIGEGLTPAVSVLASAVLPILVQLMREVSVVFLQNRDVFTKIAKEVLPVLLFALSGILAAFGFLLQGGSFLTKMFAEQVVTIWGAVAAWRAIRGDMAGASDAMKKWAGAKETLAGLDRGMGQIAEAMKTAGINAALAAKGLKGIALDTKGASEEQKRFDRILRDVRGSMASGNVVTEKAAELHEKLEKQVKKAREEFEKYQKSQGFGLSGSALKAAQETGGLPYGGSPLLPPTTAEEIANTVSALEGTTEAAAHLDAVAGQLNSSLTATGYRTKVWADHMRQAKQASFDWGGAVRQLADLVTALGIKADSSLGRIVSSVVLGVSGWMSYRKAVSDAAVAQKEWADAGNKGVSPMAQAITTAQKYAAALGAVSAAVSIYQGAQEEADTATRVATGAMQGAAAGAAFGPYGIAIGALVGAGIAYFSGPDWAAAIDVAAEDFGFAISDEMAKSIYATAQKLNVTVHVAALLSLDKMIAQAGGQTSSFGKQIGQLLAQSFAPGSEGAKLWSQTVATIWKNLVDEGTVAGAQLAIGMLQQMRDLGQVIPAAISEQIQAGLLKGAEALTKVFEGIPMSAENSAYLFSSTFWAIVKEKGILAAIDAMKPAWEKIAEMMGGEGLGGILGAIPELMVLAEGAMRPVLEGVQALIAVSKGLSDAGYMTMGAYQALGAGAQSAYDTLIAGGASEQAALAAIAPLLAEIQRLSEVYGFTIDENTQRLIDQAKANGVAFPTDPLMQVVKLLSQIVALLGGVADEADRAARGIGNIPPPPLPDQESGTGVPGEQGGYAAGGFVPETWPGGRMVRVAEPGTGGEFMIPANKTRGGGGSGAQVIEVTVNMQFPFGQLVSVMERAQLANAFRVRPDAVQDFG